MVRKKSVEEVLQVWSPKCVEQIGVVGIGVSGYLLYRLLVQAKYARSDLQTAPSCDQLNHHERSKRRVKMTGKYVFSQTLKEVRFLFCQTAEHSGPTR